MRVRQTLLACFRVVVIVTGIAYASTSELTGNLVWSTFCGESVDGASW